MVWLNNSRILAIFAVVVVHVAAGLRVESQLGSADWWMGNIYYSLSRWCVPVFIMISGALLLDPARNEGLKVFYRKRMARIIIPMVFWSLFYIGWWWFKCIMKGEAVELSVLAERLSIGQPYYHLWFLYMIVFLYLFVPFLKTITAQCSRSELLFLIILLFLFAAVNSFANAAKWSGPKLFFNLFLYYLPYFFLGYYLRTGREEPSRILMILGFVAAGVFTASGRYFTQENTYLPLGPYFTDYLSISVIPMSICAFYVLKGVSNPIGSKGIERTITPLVLGIYLIHPVFLEVINYLGFGAQRFYSVVSIPIISIVVYSASAMSAWVISTIPYVKRTI